MKTHNVKLLITVYNRIYTTVVYLPDGYEDFSSIMHTREGSYRLWSFCNIIYNLTTDEILKNRYRNFETCAAIPFLKMNAEFIEIDTLIKLVDEEVYP